MSEETLVKLLNDIQRVLTTWQKKNITATSAIKEIITILGEYVARDRK